MCVDKYLSLSILVFPSTMICSPIILASPLAMIMLEGPRWESISSVNDFEELKKNTSLQLLLDN